MALGTAFTLHDVFTEFKGYSGNSGTENLTDLFRGAGVTPLAMTSVPASGAISLGHFATRGVFDFASLAGKSRNASVAIGFSGALCMRWGANGTRLYVLESSSTLAQFDVSPAYGTTLTNKQTLSVVGTVYSFCLSPDGTVLKLLQVVTPGVRRRVLSTPWSITSADTGTLGTYPSHVVEPYGMDSIEDQSFGASPRMAFLDYQGRIRTERHAWSGTGWGGSQTTYDASSLLGTTLNPSDDLCAIQRASDGSPTSNALVIIPQPGSPTSLRFFQFVISNMGQAQQVLRTVSNGGFGNGIDVAHDGSHVAGISGSTLSRYPIMVNP